MRDINEKCRRYYRSIDPPLVKHFSMCVERYSVDSKHLEDLFLCNQLGIGLIEELLTWGYQEKSLNPTFNRWQPDTCECVLFYHFDPFIPQGDRLHIASHYGLMWNDEALEVVPRQQCIFHNISDVSVHYAVVLGENQLKNRALQIAFDTVPAKFKEEFVEELLISSDGRRRTRWIPAKRIPKSDSRRRISWFKAVYEPQWRFDEARRLHISCLGLHMTHPLIAKTVCDTIRNELGDAVYS